MKRSSHLRQTSEHDIGHLTEQEDLWSDGGIFYSQQRRTPLMVWPLSAFLEGKCCRWPRLLLMIRIIQAASWIHSPDEDTGRAELSCLMVKHLTVAPPFGAALLCSFFHQNANGRILEKVGTTAICVCTTVIAVFGSGVVRDALSAL